MAKRRRPKWSEQIECSDKNHTPKINILPAGGWQIFGGLERVGGAFFAAVVRENFGPAIFGGGPMALLMYAARCHHIVQVGNRGVLEVLCVPGVYMWLIGLFNCPDTRAVYLQEDRIEY